MKALAALAACSAALLLAAVPAAQGAGGTLDSSFSGDGITTGAGFVAAEVVRLGDGKYVVVGGGGGVLQVRRYTAAGAPDTAFGSGGTVALPVPGLQRVVAASLHETRISVVGAAGTGSGVHAMVRGSTGALDTGYSGDGLGYAALPAGSEVRGGHGPVLVADGPGDTIVLARFCRPAPTSCPSDLHQTFGQGGIVHDQTITGHTALALTSGRGGEWQPDDQAPAYYVVGHHGGGTSVSRYGHTGVRDDGFGRRRLGLAPARAQAIVDGSGRLVVARKAADRVDVTRLQPTGTVDADFGTGGTRTTTGWGNLEGIMVRNRQDEVFIGGADTSSPTRMRIAGLTAAGQPDESFAPGGIVTTQFPEAARARSLLYQPDGRIVAAGQNGTGHALARYRGRLIPTFSAPDFPSTARFFFSRPVKGVSSANVRIRLADGGAQVPGVLECFRTGRVPTSCATGAVVQVEHTPTSGAFAVNQRYTATVNEPGTTNPVADFDGEAVAPFASAFHGEPLVESFHPAISYRWARVTSSSALGRSLRRGTDTGMSASLPLDGGEQLTLYAVACPTCSAIRVDMYGTSAISETIDLRANTTTYAVPFTVDLPPGATSARIVNVGSASGARFDFDGWKVDAGPLLSQERATYGWRGELFTIGDLYEEYLPATRTPRAGAEFRFRGSTVKWRRRVGPDRGIARILIDGVQHGPLIDSYAPSTALATTEITGLPAGEHTFRVEVTGTRNPASRSTWIAPVSFEALD